MFKFIVLFIFFLIGISTIYSSSELNNILPISPCNENTNKDIISTDSSNTISLANIKDAAKRVNKFIKDNNRLPNTVSIGGKSCSMPEFLYLSTKAIINIDKGSKDGVAYKNVKAPDKPSGNKINGKKLSKAAYVSLASNVTKYIDSNSRAPNFANSPVGKIRYETLVWTFSKILEPENLPNEITITDIDRVNDIYKEENTSDFLKDTKNCQATDPTIKDKAKEITKGCTNDREKAEAIHNWVRDHIDYEFYYNTNDTHGGAVKTLEHGGGNCVDKSHLTIALFRASDLPARYGHGHCKFNSGLECGHVWSQALLKKDNKWDMWNVSDTTYSKNQLGIIKNWDTSTYTQKSGHRQPEITF